jgi:hypothetical protein
MRIVGPQNFTVGATTSIVDPAASGGNPSVAVQIQNSSAYQLQVNAGGALLSIQPFWAQTVEISGQPVAIEPLTGVATGACPITLAFLLGTAPNDGEQLPDGTWIESPPQSDGSLTAAAVTAAITGALSTQGALDFLGTFSGTIGVGQQLHFNPGYLPALHVYQSLVVVITNTAAPGTLWQAVNVTDSADFPGQVTNTNQPGQVLVLPVANALGDLLSIQTTATTMQGGVSFSVYGSTSGLINEVITPSGNPLGTYSVGGTVSLAITQTVGTATILAAPTTGFVYLLKRMVANPAASASLTLHGLTSGKGYALSTPVVPLDNIGGIPCPEGITATAVGSTVGATLFYDVVPVQTVQ